MPVYTCKRLFSLAGTTGTLLILFMITISWEPLSIHATATNNFLYLPFVMQKNGALAAGNWATYVNYYRQLANVPAVGDEAVLSDNCFQHARYMAENHHLTHNQDPTFPWASPGGQLCAGNGNAWLGSEFFTPYWKPTHSIDGWMGSVGHRLWLLYPTTLIFGYGFYTAADNGAGAALDVLSRANFNADTGYVGWPIRYPAPGQADVPSTNYPITVHWRYFGPTPVLASTTLAVAGGAPIAHTANTALPVGHKGIQILPGAPLPQSTTIVVSITGTYGGAPFSHSWHFSTGSTPAYQPEQQLTADFSLERNLSPIPHP